MPHTHAQPQPQAIQTLEDQLLQELENDFLDMSDSRSEYTSEEEDNIAVVHEYMRITYSPKDCRGASSVAHLCVCTVTNNAHSLLLSLLLILQPQAKGNQFVAPTTFPGVTTCEQYAEAHKGIFIISCYFLCFPASRHADDGSLK